MKKHKTIDNYSSTSLEVQRGRALELADKLVASAAGNVIALLLGGPVGLIFGQLAGTFLSHQAARALEELEARGFSPRERLRAYFVLKEAANQIEERKLLTYVKNKTQETNNGSDSWTELDSAVEAILELARRTIEERKLPYIAALLVKFSEDSNNKFSNLANYVPLVERMTFRQLMILAIAHKNTIGGLSLSNIPLGEDNQSAHINFIRHDILTLDQVEGLISHDPGKMPAFGGGITVVPADLKLTTMGTMVYNLMGLDSISLRYKDDWDDILKILM